MAHDLGVPVIPNYDTGPDAVELMAETAAMMGCDRLADRHQPAGRAVSLVQGFIPATIGGDPAAGDSGGMVSPPPPAEEKLSQPPDQPQPPVVEPEPVGHSS